MLSPSSLTIDLSRYRNNLDILRKHLSPGTRFCAVVKAEAYGHGLVPIARVAEQAGVDALGVVDNEEIAGLWEAGISLPVLRLRPATSDEVEEVIRFGVEELVGDLDTIDRLSRVAQNRRTTLSVHLKVDVGIGRMGISSSRAEPLVTRARNAEGLRIAGLMTHFPSADDPDPDITRRQMERFRSILKDVRHLLGEDVIVHAANSAAMLRFPHSQLGMVRVGLACYGLRPSEVVPLPSGILPVMRWTTRIVQLRTMRAGETVGYGMSCRLERDSLVASLPIGYADGYFHSLSGSAEVLVRGQRCPALGRISMDLICVDVSEVPNVAVGDEVILLGDGITADELATRAGTISYEIFTRIGGAAHTARTYL